MKLKPTREQVSFYNLFTRYVKDDGTIYDPDFRYDIEKLRKANNIRESTYENIELVGDSVNADEIPSPLVQFMMKYKFPLRMDNFLYHFIVNDEVDLSKLRDGIYLLDNTEMLASGDRDPELNFKNYVNDTDYTKYTHVTLAIPAEATITQITKAIATHQSFIKDRQAEINGSRKTRTRSQPMAERDNVIMTLYNQGVKPREIVPKLPEKWRGLLTSSDITKIVNRYKSKRP